MSDIIDKNSLRKEAQRCRERLNPTHADYESASKAFFEAIKPDQDKIIAGYWPIKREFDVRYIIGDFLKMGGRCCLPVIQEQSRILKFALWRDEEALKKGPFGIMQPVRQEFVEPDIVLIPLLAYDRKGHRLGYGSGYYDATLEYLRLKQDVSAVGVGFGEQACLFNLPCEPHDQKMDWMITPQGAMQF